MSAVTYNVNEVDPGEITGTYNETVYKEDGSVQTYANWQPLEEVVFGGYTFTFTKGDKNECALYTAKEGSAWTIRVYVGGTMTIAAPAGQTLKHINLVTDSSKAANVSTVSDGAFEFNADAKAIEWNASSTAGVEKVTFTFSGTYRISAVEFTDDVTVPDTPVEPGETIKYVVNDIPSGDITGTYNETVLNEDGTVKSYANWQPLEKVVLGDYTLTFSNEEGNAPALYTAKEGGIWTIRVYNGSKMTVAGPEGKDLPNFALITDTSKAANCSGVNLGGFVFEDGAIKWNHGAADVIMDAVTFTFSGTYRIKEIEFGIEAGETPETPAAKTIAELLAVENGSEYSFEGRAVVSYSNGANVYVYDESGATLLYLKGLAEQLPAGTVVTAMEGKRSDYNGTVEFIPTLATIKTDGTAEVEAVKCSTLAEVEATTVDTYIMLSEVDFTLDAENAKYGLATFTDGTEIAVYNAFTASSYTPVVYPEAGKYNLYGLRSAFNGVTQFNFVKAEEVSGVNGIEVEAGEAEYYNLQGIKVANPEKGLYIKVENGKSVKVIF